MAPGTRSATQLLIRLYNARLATRSGLTYGELWIQNGKIVDPETRFWNRESSAADRRIDCLGMIIAPGFIDIQLQKACDVDFTSLGEEGAEAETAAGRAVQRVRETLPEYGVTSFCPMIRPSEPCKYPRLRARLRPRATSLDHNDNTVSTKPSATLLGLHLDGPFLSTTYIAKGHDVSLILPSLEAGPLGEADALTAVYGPFDAEGPPLPAIVTLAPELPGAMAAVQKLKAAGVVIGLGRTAANLEECRRGEESGAKLLTNLLDSMRPFHHRDPGPLGLLVGEEQEAGITSTHADTAGTQTAEQAKNARDCGSSSDGVFYTMSLDCRLSHPNSVRS